MPVHTAPKMFLDVFLSPWRVGGVFGRMFMTLSICQKYVLRKNGTEILKAGHEREICIGRIFAINSENVQMAAVFQVCCDVVTLCLPEGL